MAAGSADVRTSGRHVLSNLFGHAGACGDRVRRLRLPAVGMDQRQARIRADDQSHGRRIECDERSKEGVLLRALRTGPGAAARSTPVRPDVLDLGGPHGRRRPGPSRQVLASRHRDAVRGGEAPALRNRRGPAARTSNARSSSSTIIPRRRWRHAIRHTRPAWARASPPARRLSAGRVSTRCCGRTALRSRMRQWASRLRAVRLHRASGAWKPAIANRLSRIIGRVGGDGLLNRIARSAPEFQTIERALGAADDTDASAGAAAGNRRSPSVPSRSPTGQPPRQRLRRFPADGARALGRAARLSRVRDVLDEHRRPVLLHRRRRRHSRGDAADADLSSRARGRIGLVAGRRGAAAATESRSAASRGSTPSRSISGRPTCGGSDGPMIFNGRTGGSPASVLPETVHAPLSARRHASVAHASFLKCSQGSSSCRRLRGRFRVFT